MLEIINLLNKKSRSCYIPVHIFFFTDKMKKNATLNEIKKMNSKTYYPST